MIGGKAGIFETRNWIEMEEWINSELKEHLLGRKKYGEEVVVRVLWEWYL